MHKIRSIEACGSEAHTYHDAGNFTIGHSAADFRDGFRFRLRSEVLIRVLLLLRIPEYAVPDTSN